jgi:DNA-directed RNA polymerase specialized sigma subunit
MTAKQELKKIRKIDYLIRQMIETVDGLRTQLTGTAPQTDGVRVQNSAGKDRMAAVMAKIIDTENLINENIDYLVDLKSSVVQTINRIENEDERNILLARYLNCKKWTVIADEMDFSLQRIYQIHGNALISYKNSKIILE